jgi:predicted branched-subunit amino acid permease
VIGVAAGDLITDVKPFGLDYALIAMFIALLVFQIHNRKTLAVAVIAGLVAVALQLAGFSQWNVILATLTGATAGVFIDVWTRKLSS